MSKVCFISYLKVRNIVSMGCFYHLVRVNDFIVETQPIQSIPVVSKFPDDLSGNPLEREK